MICVCVSQDKESNMILTRFNVAKGSNKKHVYSPVRRRHRQKETPMEWESSDFMAIFHRFILLMLTKSVTPLGWQTSDALNGDVALKNFRFRQKKKTEKLWTIYTTHTLTNFAGRNIHKMISRQRLCCWTSSFWVEIEFSLDEKMPLPSVV